MGYRARRKAEIEGLTYQARLIANLDRYPKDKYLPSLEELLGPAGAKHPQSSAEMLANFEEMQAAGAPLKIKKVA